MSIIKLVALPLLDVAEFPLRLPLPDQFNSGGYMLPSREYSYSPIDLLVAGLESARLGLITSSLTNFFTSHKGSVSEFKVFLLYKINNEIFSESIAYIKSINNAELNRVMHKNAPLTFSGVF